MSLNTKRVILLYTMTTTGYIIMLLLVGCIMYLWFHEWRELEKLETENRRINIFRQEVHHVYGEMTGLSLLGESVLEWDDEDLERYHIQRMETDSMLRRFKTNYPVECIDSVRLLLEDKEQQMRLIVQALNEQQTLNEKMAQQVPVIVQKSVQEHPQKTKRKGFLGIFGKKEETKPIVTITMLRSFNRNIISEQKEQIRRLSAHADSLVARNAKLNRQLQSLIRQIDDKAQDDMQKRETEITEMREQSFMQIGGLTGFVLLLLVISYIIIHRNANHIKRYKRETTDLIGQLQQVVKKMRH